ncbi:MAG: ATPase, partial [Methanosarcinaceae archaeon]|nr:ATPase [Methanosarcinaceae archaeon]
EGKPLADDVDIFELADITNGYVGADIDAICREASMLALRHVIRPKMTKDDVLRAAENIGITRSHFISAISRVRSTTSMDKMQMYERSARIFSKGPNDQDLTSERSS